MLLRWRSARAALTTLNHEFRLRLAAARAKDDEEEVQRLKSEFGFHRSEYTDELLGMESRALVEEARRLDIYLTDMLSTNAGEDYWEQGHFDEYLQPEARRFLGRRIREERGARWKTRMEVYALTISFLFGLMGIALTAYNTWKSAHDARIIDALHREVEGQSKRLSGVELRLNQSPAISAKDTSQSLIAKRTKRARRRAN
jgi:hypothetical protein